MDHQSFVYCAKVVSVYDGDTCKVDIDLGFGITFTGQTLRLYGINSPEIKGGDESSKQHAFESKQFLSDLILNKTILIQTFKDKKEKYGRWLAKIWIDLDNKNICVNDMMIENKKAVVATYGNELI